MTPEVVGDAHRHPAVDVTAPAKGQEPAVLQLGHPAVNAG